MKDVILIFLNARWYKDLDFASNLPPYFRDRLVEMYLYTPGYYIEPQSSRARIMLTKFYAVVTLADDTCDSYASIPDAESLANSLERYKYNKKLLAKIVCVSFHPDSDYICHNRLLESIFHDRWVLDDVTDKQPDYLKFVLKFILETFKEFERELINS